MKYLILLLFFLSANIYALELSILTQRTIDLSLTSADYTTTGNSGSFKKTNSNTTRIQVTGGAFVLTCHKTDTPYNLAVRAGGSPYIILTSSPLNIFSYGGNRTFYIDYRATGNLLISPGDTSTTVVFSVISP